MMSPGLGIQGYLKFGTINAGHHLFGWHDELTQPFYIGGVPFRAV